MDEHDAGSTATSAEVQSPPTICSNVSTIERRRKKRESNRMAQRASRERIKYRILYLEEMIDQLQAVLGNRDALSAVETIVKLKQENAKLRRELEQATFKRGIITGQKAKGSLQESTDTNGNVRFYDSPSEVNSSDRGMEPKKMLINQSQPTLDNADPVGFHTDEENTVDFKRPNPLLDESSDPLFNLINFDPASIFWKTPKSPPSNLYPDSARILSDHDKWHVTNDVYTWGLDSYRKLYYYYGTYGAVKPIMAIFEGWHILDEKEKCHPVYRALQWVDECLFGDWHSKAQRIAMILIKMRLMNYLSKPTKENLEKVPVFLRPRPSQEAIVHPPIIEFVIWPALRERLVFHHKCYSDGALSRAYTSHIRFHWPFPDALIMANDCKLSDLFEHYAFDINNWAMEEEFFTELAEMREDIPSVKIFK